MNKAYKDAGVDTEGAESMLHRITERAGAAAPGQLAGIGGFAAAFELPAGMARPVVVAGCDGVGSKVQLLAAQGQLRTAGWDLVAMCANDIACSGAAPWFFLDYYAGAQLDRQAMGDVVDGIVDACGQAGCALAGGETSQLPGMLAGAAPDLAGFAVGLVEKDAMLGPARVARGDSIIGLQAASIGCNGFSLVRRILDAPATPLADTLGEATAARLLAPTPLYCIAVAGLAAAGIAVHAAAHVTGGGLPANVPRMLPAGLRARLDTSRWQLPQVLREIQRRGNLADRDLLQVFNHGIGMALAVPQNSAAAAVDWLRAADWPAAAIGQVVAGEGLELV